MCLIFAWYDMNDWATCLSSSSRFAWRDVFSWFWLRCDRNSRNLQGFFRLLLKPSLLTSYWPKQGTCLRLQSERTLQRYMAKGWKGEEVWLLMQSFHHISWVKTELSHESNIEFDCTGPRWFWGIDLYWSLISTIMNLYLSQRAVFSATWQLICFLLQ